MRIIFWRPAVLFALLGSLWLLTPHTAFSQTGPWAVALGLEGNMNSYRNASGASWLAATVDLGGSFAAGIKTGFSHNFSDTGTLEMAALGRWYFLSLGPDGPQQSRLFAQAELGADLIFYEQKTVPAFLGGLALGWRIPLGAWYLEPAVRGGYPYIWGAGLGFGRKI
jgi:hypothetical protein